MKNEWGLQCRCSNQNLTLYIIVISQCCWVLVEYTIHFVPKAHANQVFPTRFKTGGSPANNVAGRSCWVSCSPCGYTKPQGESWRQAQQLELWPWGLHMAALASCGALGPAGSLQMRVTEWWPGRAGSTAELPVTSALGRRGGIPDLSKKRCNVRAERLKDVLVLLLTIIWYYLKNTSGFF